jgi:hypothetical protein
VAYYFAFRVVGHWLSIRGGRQALRHTQWSGLPCAPLTELRALATPDAAGRSERLQSIATALSLPHLPVFFQRVVS